MVFEVGIGVSENLTAKEAAEEAIQCALKEIPKPTFALTFATIQYKKNNGFKIILDTIYEKIGKEIPLVGGTVSGFISPKGIQTHGLGILLVNCDSETMALCEKGSKAKPRQIGKIIGRAIEKFNPNKKNKVILCFIAGPQEPAMLMNPVINSLFEKIPQKLFWTLRDALLEISFRVFGYGQGREQELFETMDEYSKKFVLVGGSTFDDIKVLENFQFCGRKICQNAIVAIAFALDETILTSQKSQLSETEKEVTIKANRQKFCVDLINGKPAVQEYLNSFGLIGNYQTRHVKENLKTTLYYPLGNKVGNDLVDAFAIGLFTGSSMMSERKINTNKAKIFYTSSKQILEKFDSCINEVSSSQDSFAFVCQGFHAIGILGRKIELLKKMLDGKFGQKYFLIFDIGEYKKGINEKTFLTNYGVSAIALSQATDKK